MHIKIFNYHVLNEIFAVLLNRLEEETMSTMSTPRLTGNSALSAWEKLTDDFESVERVAWKEGTTLFLSKNTTFVHKWQEEGEEDYELYEEDRFDLLMNEIGAAEAEIARSPIYAIESS